jgi:hypothetical protein
LTGIINTIVVNLGGSDDDNKNEEEDMGKSNADKMCLHRSMMQWERKTMDRMLVEISLEKRLVVRGEAMEKKIISKKNLQ